MSEIWKDVSGYEGLYQVSNQGNIRSLHPHGSIKENPTLIIGDVVRGYRRVDLRKKGMPRVRMLVHRLVAETFIPNPENKTEVNHIDGDKRNNSVSNLEWCTHSDNMKHAAAMGLVNPQKAIKARWGHG